MKSKNKSKHPKHRDQLTKSNSNIHETDQRLMENSSNSYFSSDCYLDCTEFEQFEAVELLPQNDGSLSFSDGATIIDFNESYIVQGNIGKNFKSESVENQNHVLSGSTLELVFQHLSLQDLKQVSK